MTIKNDITSEIDTLIGGMSVSGGYNFDYNNVNEYRPGSKTYPNVKSEYSEEDFLDPDEQMVDSYSSNLLARFRVTVDDSVAVQLALSRVLEDFQRLLEAEHADLQTIGWIKADLLRDSREFTHVRKRPGLIEMEWQIDYRVKRSDPSVTT